MQPSAGEDFVPDDVVDLFDLAEAKFCTNEGAGGIFGMLLDDTADVDDVCTFNTAFPFLDIPPTYHNMEILAVLFKMKNHKCINLVLITELTDII